MEAVQYAVNRLDADKSQPQVAGDLALALAYARDTAAAAIVTDEMVDRFLSWPLPASVCSDPCSTMKEYPHQRVGTSLLTADEARQMLQHVLSNAATQELPAVNSASRQADHGNAAGAASDRDDPAVLLTHPCEPVRDSAKQPAVAAPFLPSAAAFGGREIEYENCPCGGRRVKGQSLPSSALETFVQCAPDSPHVHVCRHCGLALSATASTPRVEAKHICGVRGFNPMIDGPCLACASQAIRPTDSSRPS